MIRGALALFLLSACGSDPDAQPVPFRVTPERGDLLYVWIDSQGFFRDSQRVDGIAPDRRALVRVEALGLDPARRAPPDVVYLVDLSALGADGSYPVRTAPRTEFEALGRQAPVLAEGPVDPMPGRTLSDPVPQATALPGATAGPPGATAAPGPFPRVVVYGADWCGPCHQAEAYLRRRGIPFVHRDVDRDPGARRDMQAAMSRAGRSPGPIPVIDVGGRIIVGFDAGAIERALRG